MSIKMRQPTPEQLAHATRLILQIDHILSASNDNDVAAATLTGVLTLYMLRLPPDEVEDTGNHILDLAFDSIESYEREEQRQ